MKVASFYDRIGYKGPFGLSVDATAILPGLRIRGKKPLELFLKRILLYPQHKTSLM